MEYNPRQEREIRDAMCLPAGEYNFEVVKAEEKTSKKGNDMIELQLRVFPHDGGSPRLLNDWLVPGSDLGELKMNRFCHSTGIQEEYFDGSFSALHCEGVSGRVRIIVQKDPDYGDQPRVKDYIVEADQESQEPLGVPASQTKRALKNAHKGNDELAQDYETQLAVNNDDVPF